MCPSDRGLLADGTGDGIGVEVDVAVTFAVPPAGGGRRLGLATSVDAGPVQAVQELPAAVRRVPIHLRADPATLTAGLSIGSSGGCPASVGDLGGGLAVPAALVVGLAPPATLGLASRLVAAAATMVAGLVGPDAVVVAGGVIVAGEVVDQICRLGCVTHVGRRHLGVGDDLRVGIDATWPL
jgi:hypothetical protein